MGFSVPMSEHPRLRKHSLRGHFVFDTLNCGEEAYEWPTEELEDAIHRTCSLAYDHDGNHRYKDFEWESNETLDTELIEKWSAHE